MVTRQLAEVQELWDRNRRKDAIELLLERINSRPAQEQRPLVLQLVSYVRELGDRPGAERLLQQLLTLHPADSQIQGLLQELRQEQAKGGAGPDASDRHPAVMAEWAGLDLSPAAAPPMPATVTGRVLNLETATLRWQNMELQIERLGWGATHRRFAAQGATLEQARAVGLRSAGELGLWNTTKALLQEWLASQPGPDAVLHVIEDDAILNPALPLLLEPLHSCQPRVGLLVTEAFLTTPLYQQFRQLERRRQQSGQSLLFVAGSHYLACTSSYLMRSAGARIVLEAMEQLEAAGQLLPLDLAWRQLIRSGRLAAAISLPFFSTIPAASASDSAIQTGLSAAVGLAKGADLALRRLLYLQTWDPAAANQVLRELAHLLSSTLPPDQQEDLILQILARGRAAGWLGNY